MRESIITTYGEDLASLFTKPQIRRLLDRLERISCKIAPINSITGNTQTVARWELNVENPNYAAQEECQRIFIVLLEDLLGFMGLRKYTARECLYIFEQSRLTKEEVMLALADSSRLGSVELPIEYKVPLGEGGKHVADNLFWYSPPKAINSLRAWVNNDEIVTKIQVKSYLTDRRQTGDYQTNREIRWETNPNSPQHASRKDCTETELKLLSQISIFVGAPDLNPDLELLVEEILGGKFEKDSFKCPISGKPIFFNEFYERIASPVHGRSGFQVGHLNPLATTGSHNAVNISWITDLGNRVQGDASLEVITNDIFYMAEFHKDRLNLTWDKIQEITKRMKG